MSVFPKSKIILMAAIILGLAAKPSHCAIFNAAADFSTTNNPNGPWRYGWSSTLESDFNLNSSSGKVTPTIDFWNDPTRIYMPTVTHNSTGSVDNSHSTITFQPNQLALHPGYYGEYSILRWIAPEAGTYLLSAAFTGLDHVGPTTTDVHVLHNGILLFSDLVNGFGASSAKSFATTGVIDAGDTIDFAVGYGSNQTLWYDTTGLEAIISTTPIAIPKSVPEPSPALSLLAFGTFGASSLLKRKQQQKVLNSVVSDR